MKKIRLTLEQLEDQLELNTLEESQSIKGGYDIGWFLNNWGYLRTGNFIPDGNGGYVFAPGILLNEVTVSSANGATADGGYGGYGSGLGVLDTPLYIPGQDGTYVAIGTLRNPMPNITSYGGYPNNNAIIRPVTGSYGDPYDPYAHYTYIDTDNEVLYTAETIANGLKIIWNSSVGCWQYITED